MRAAEVIRAVRKLVAPLERRVRLMAMRAVVSGVSEALKMRGLQVKLLADDAADDVEHFEPYGITARPANGAEAIVLSIGGSEDHLVAVVVSDRGSSRPTDLQVGEVALYSRHGQRIYLRTDGSIALVPKAGAHAHIGQEGSTDFVALASKVLDELNAIRTWANAHTHSGVTTGPGSTGTATPMPAPSSVAATKAKAT